MDLLVWNYQGSASKEFLRVLMDLLPVHKPKILGLLELRVSDDQADRICRKLNFDNWVRVEAVGFSGGIWVFWKDEYAVNIISTHPQFVVFKVRNRGDEPWFLAIVYGSPNSRLRQRLWMDLVPDRIGILRAWLVVGEFNAVVSNDEVST